MREWYHWVLYVAIALVVFMVFRNFQNSLRMMEGMTNNDSNSKGKTSKESGMTDNAAAYAAALKTATIKLQDSFLISKYRSDYESAILNLDDLINNLMLKTALSVNENDPISSIEKLAKMQQAKVALNSVMKFVDSQ